MVANEAYVGGGIVNYGTVTLNRVDLVGNAADIEAYGAFGGGLYNRNSLALLTDVNFIANYSSDFGGGMANKQSTSYLSNVTFRSNNATYEGGGFYYSESLVTMSNVTFSDNRGWSEGGGIRSFDSISTLTNVTFNSNFSASGGGINFYAIDYYHFICIKPKPAISKQPAWPDASRGMPGQAPGCMAVADFPALLLPVLLRQFSRCASQQPCATWRGQHADHG